MPYADFDSQVMITIDPAMVKPGMWNSDAHAQYAVAMDGKNGEIVWYRSADWRTYARQFGFGRVAIISPEMACDKGCDS